MKLNKDFHITTKYFGRKFTFIPKGFLAGEEVDVHLHGFIYIPGKIITGICYHNDYPKSLEIENEFPHVTLMTGDWKPFASNKAMNALFSS